MQQFCRAGNVTDNTGVCTRAVCVGAQLPQFCLTEVAQGCGACRWRGRGPPICPWAGRRDRKAAALEPRGMVRVAVWGGAAACTHRRREQWLDILVGLIRGTEEHPEGLDSTHVPRLQVAEDDDHAVLEGKDWERNPQDADKAGSQRYPTEYSESPSQYVGPPAQFLTHLSEFCVPYFASCPVLPTAWEYAASSPWRCPYPMMHRAHPVQLLLSIYSP